MKPQSAISRMAGETSRLFCRIWCSMLLISFSLFIPGLAQDMLWVTGAAPDRLFVVDMSTLGVCDEVPINAATGLGRLAFAPDGSRAYVISDDGLPRLSVIDVATMSEVDIDGDPGNGITRIQLGTDPGVNYDLPVDIAVTPDGQYAYITDFGRYSNRIYLVDLVNQVKVQNIIAGGRPTYVAITPDGSRVYVTNHNTGNVSVISTATQSKVVDIPLSDIITRGVAINPAGTRVYVGSQTKVSAIDPLSNTVVGSVVRSNAAFAGVAVTPDGSRVYAASINHGRIYLFDTTAPGVELTEVDQILTPAGHLLLDYDGSRMVIGGYPMGISILLTASKEIVASGILPPSQNMAFPPLPLTGSIAGTVSANGECLAGVAVKLLCGSDPAMVIDETVTNAPGSYEFCDVPSDLYQVMIIEPLGYSILDIYENGSAGGDGVIEVLPDAASTVDFDLNPEVIVNQARGKGYWKHQFDVYVLGRGNAQESETALIGYIAAVANYYSAHFDIFDDICSGDSEADFVAWQDVLSVKGNAGMAAKAKAQLAALVLNMMSLKIAQYEVVTADPDGRSAGDVLTYVSNLLSDGDAANDELAKDLAEQVNQQQVIESGIVPAGTILYKTGRGEDPDGNLSPTYTLAQNYPNPFNPQTIIAFTLSEAGAANLVIYDIAGRKVRTLVSGQQFGGDHQVQWDGTDANGERVASGVYLYRLSTAGFNATRKMLLLH